MAWKNVHARLWWIATLVVGGLFAAVVLAGVVGLLLNRSVEEATDEALGYDILLEGEGDNLHTATLLLLDSHHSVGFGGPSPEIVADLDRSYALLRKEIDDLDKIGVRDPAAPQPEDFRALAEEYYAGFRPTLDGAADRAEVERAGDRGLEKLAELESAAREIDDLGEKLSTAAFENVERATRRARLVLLAVLGGLFLAGTGLAYAAGRTVRELRRSYAAQREAAEESARASQAKADFLADASHELRTPLTVLRVNAEVGLQLKDEDARQEVLEDILQESARMSRMVEDLLFLARSDSDSLPLQPETVAVEPFLAELAGRAEPLAHGRSASFRAEMDGAGEARMDPARIEQAVLILVDNAAKYGPEGGLVTLASSTETGELAIEVRDAGPGIPEEELSRVFERFYRVDKTRTRKQGGSGLGLPIARTIAAAHGGRIEVESRVGTGTRISLYLPLLTEARPEDRPSGRRALRKPFS